MEKKDTSPGEFYISRKINLMSSSIGAKGLATVFIVLFLGFAFFLPSELKVVSESLLGFTISKFGWFYLLTTFVLLSYCVYLTLSRFGGIKLGDDDEEPQYSYLSWLAMLFSAGMGIGLVFYGVSEPLSHFHDPPLDLAVKGTPQAAYLALRYTFFHWGFHPWAIYAIVGMGLAYIQFRKKDVALISRLFAPLGVEKDSFKSSLIDAIAITGVSFGVATSLGLGSLQIHSGLTRLFGLSNDISITLAIIFIATVLYLLSATTGLDRGIKYLSNTNMILAFLLLGCILFMGPTDFLIELLFTSVGIYLQNFITMSFRMAPFSDSSWLKDWTFFYWAWWISWAPFVGAFIARISRGRTIREFMIGVLVLPTIISMVWFSVLGGSAIYMEMYKGIDLSAVVSTDLPGAIFHMLGELPGGYIFSLIAILLVLVFFVTSADSATFVLGILSSKGNPDPSVQSKLLWGCLVSLVASGLLLNGGLDALQSAAIVISIPFAILLFILVFSLHKELLKEFHKKLPEPADIESKD